MEKDDKCTSMWEGGREREGERGWVWVDEVKRVSNLEP